MVLSTITESFIPSQVSEDQYFYIRNETDLNGIATTLREQRLGRPPTVVELEQLDPVREDYDTDEDFEQALAASKYDSAEIVRVLHRSGAAVSPTAAEADRCCRTLGGDRGRATADLRPPDPRRDPASSAVAPRRQRACPRGPDRPSPLSPPGRPDRPRHLARVGRARREPGAILTRCLGRIVPETP